MSHDRGVQNTPQTKKGKEKISEGFIIPDTPLLYPKVIFFFYFWVWAMNWDTWEHATSRETDYFVIVFVGAYVGLNFHGVFFIIFITITMPQVLDKKSSSVGIKSDTNISDLA